MNSIGREGALALAEALGANTPPGLIWGRSCLFLKVPLGFREGGGWRGLVWMWELRLGSGVSGLG